MTDFEREDLELEFIMGDKFQDLSKAKEAPKCPEANVAPKVSKKSEEADWHPVKPKNNLADCAKSTLIYGGLNGLILYWQINGLMADSIALPCMLVCALLAGIGIGKAFGGAK